MSNEKKRVFDYNGTQLDDPNPALSPTQVRDHYSSHYGELTTATVSGPATLPDGREKFTFVKAIPTKG